VTAYYKTGIGTSAHRMHWRGLLRNLMAVPDVFYIVRPQVGCIQIPTALHG